MQDSQPNPLHSVPSSHSECQPGGEALGYQPGGAGMSLGIQGEEGVQEMLQHQLGAEKMRFIALLCFRLWVNHE